MKEILFYIPVTLRTDCIRRCLDSIHETCNMDNIDLLVVDNSTGSSVKLLEHIADYRGVKFFIMPRITPLTQLQTKITAFYSQHKYYVFSADDVFYKEPGYIEEALKHIDDKHFVSFTTDQDPLAYMYDHTFFNEVGFDTRLKGKDGTDNSLRKRIREAYGNLFSIGQYWKPVPYEGSWGCWGSKYVTHINGADDVNLLLEAEGIDSGSKRSDKPNATIIEES